MISSGPGAGGEHDSSVCKSEEAERGDVSSLDKELEGFNVLMAVAANARKTKDQQLMG